MSELGPATLTVRALINPALTELKRLETQGGAILSSLSRNLRITADGTQARSEIGRVVAGLSRVQSQALTISLNASGVTTALSAIGSSLTRIQTLAATPITLTINITGSIAQLNAAAAALNAARAANAAGGGSGGGGGGSGAVSAAQALSNELRTLQNLQRSGLVTSAQYEAELRRIATAAGTMAAGVAAGSREAVTLTGVVRTANTALNGLGQGNRTVAGDLQNLRTQLASARASFDAGTTTARQYEAELRRLQGELRTLASSGQASAQQLLQINNQIGNTARQINTLNGRVNLTGLSGNIRTALGGITQSLSSVLPGASNVVNIFNGISTAGGPVVAVLGAVTLALGGLALGFAKGVEVAGRYEQKIADIRALTSPTAQELKNLDQAARSPEMVKLGFGASAAAAAVLELSRAGVSASASTGGTLKAALELAGAAAIDTSSAVKFGVTAITAFGLNVETDMGRAADVFANFANATVLGAEDLATGIGAVGPVARASGLSLEQLGGVLATAAQGGFKRMDDAGTSLKTLLTNLRAPTADARAQLEQMGIKVFDASGKQRDMTQVLAELASKLKTMTDQQRAATEKIIGGSDAMRLLAILSTQSTDAISKNSAIMGKQGEAARVAAERNKSYEGAQRQLKAAMENLGITLGERLLPFLTRVVGAINGFVQGFTTLISPTKAGQKAISDLSKEFPILGAALKLGGDLVKGLGDAFRAAFGLAKQVWETVLKPVLNALEPLFSGVFGALGGIVKGALGVIANLLKGLAALLRGDFKGVWDSLKGVVRSALQAVIDLIVSIVPAVVNAAARIGSGIAEGVKKGFQEVYNGLSDFLTLGLSKSLREGDAIEAEGRRLDALIAEQTRKREAAQRALNQTGSGFGGSVSGGLTYRAQASSPPALPAPTQQTPLQKALAALPKDYQESARAQNLLRSATDDTQKAVIRLKDALEQAKKAGDTGAQVRLYGALQALTKASAEARTASSALGAALSSGRSKAQGLGEDVQALQKRLELAKVNFESGATTARQYASELATISTTAGNLSRQKPSGGADYIALRQTVKGAKDEYAGLNKASEEAVKKADDERKARERQARAVADLEQNVRQANRQFALNIAQGKGTLETVDAMTRRYEDLSSQVDALPEGLQATARALIAQGRAAIPAAEGIARANAETQKLKGSVKDLSTAELAAASKRIRSRQVGADGKAGTGYLMAADAARLKVIDTELETRYKADAKLLERQQKTSADLKRTIQNRIEDFKLLVAQEKVSTTSLAKFGQALEGFKVKIQTLPPALRAQFSALLSSGAALQTEARGVIAAKNAKDEYAKSNQKLAQYVKTATLAELEAARARVVASGGDEKRLALVDAQIDKLQKKVDLERENARTVAAGAVADGAKQIAAADTASLLSFYEQRKQAAAGNLDELYKLELGFGDQVRDARNRQAQSEAEVEKTRLRAEYADKLKLAGLSGEQRGALEEQLAQRLAAVDTALNATRTQNETARVRALTDAETALRDARVKLGQDADKAILKNQLDALADKTSAQERDFQEQLAQEGLTAQQKLSILENQQQLLLALKKEELDASKRLEMQAEIERYNTTLEDARKRGILTADLSEKLWNEHLSNTDAITRRYGASYQTYSLGLERQVASGKVAVQKEVEAETKRLEAERRAELERVSGLNKQAASDLVSNQLSGLSDLTRGQRDAARKSLEYWLSSYQAQGEAGRAAADEIRAALARLGAAEDEARRKALERAGKGALNAQALSDKAAGIGRPESADSARQDALNSFQGVIEEIDGQIADARADLAELSGRTDQASVTARAQLEGTLKTLGALLNSTIARANTAGETAFKKYQQAAQDRAAEAALELADSNRMLAEASGTYSEQEKKTYLDALEDARIYWLNRVATAERGSADFITASNKLQGVLNTQRQIREADNKQAADDLKQQQDDQKANAEGVIKQLEDQYGSLETLTGQALDAVSKVLLGAQKTFQDAGQAGKTALELINAALGKVAGQRAKLQREFSSLPAFDDRAVASSGQRVAAVGKPETRTEVEARVREGFQPEIERLRKEKDDLTTAFFALGESATDEQVASFNASMKRLLLAFQNLYTTARAEAKKAGDAFDQQAQDTAQEAALSLAEIQRSLAQASGADGEAAYRTALAANATYWQDRLKNAKRGTEAEKTLYLQIAGKALEAQKKLTDFDAAVLEQTDAQDALVARGEALSQNLSGLEGQVERIANLDLSDPLKVDWAALGGDLTTVTARIAELRKEAEELGDGVALNVLDDLEGRLNGATTALEGYQGQLETDLKDLTTVSEARLLEISVIPTLKPEDLGRVQAELDQRKFQASLELDKQTTLDNLSSEYAALTSELAGLDPLSPDAAQRVAYLQSRLEAISALYTQLAGETDLPFDKENLTDASQAAGEYADGLKVIDTNLKLLSSARANDSIDVSEAIALLEAEAAKGGALAETYRALARALRGVQLARGERAERNFDEDLAQVDGLNEGVQQLRRDLEDGKITLEDFAAGALGLTNDLQTLADQPGLDKDLLDRVQRLLALLKSTPEAVKAARDELAKKLEVKVQIEADTAALEDGEGALEGLNNRVQGLRRDLENGKISFEDFASAAYGLQTELETLEVPPELKARVQQLLDLLKNTPGAVREARAALNQLEQGRIQNELDTLDNLKAAELVGEEEYLAERKRLRLEYLEWQRKAEIAGLALDDPNRQKKLEQINQKYASAEVKVTLETDAELKDLLKKRNLPVRLIAEFKGGFDSATEGFKNAVSGVASSLGGLLNPLGLLGQIIEKINPVGEILAGVFAVLEEPLKALQEPLRAIGGVVGTILAPALNLLGSVVSAVAGIFASIYDAIVGFLTSLPIIGGLFEGLKRKPTDPNRPDGAGVSTSENLSPKEQNDLRQAKRDFDGGLLNEKDYQDKVYAIRQAALERQYKAEFDAAKGNLDKQTELTRKYTLDVQDLFDEVYAKKPEKGDGKADTPPPKGSIADLEAQRSALEAQFKLATSDEERAQLRAAIDALTAQIDALGKSVEKGPPPGSIADLQARISAAQARFQNATSDSERRAIAREIDRLNIQLERLQNQGKGGSGQDGAGNKLSGGDIRIDGSFNREIASTLITTLVKLDTTLSDRLIPALTGQISGAGKGQDDSKMLAAYGRFDASTLIFDAATRRFDASVGKFDAVAGRFEGAIGQLERSGGWAGRKL